VKTISIILGAVLLTFAAASWSADCRAQDEIVNILHPPPPPHVPFARTSPPSPAEQHLADLALACIRTHAAGIERLDERLTDAVDFLVSDLCRVEVGNHDRYVRNTELLAQMRGNLSFDYSSIIGDGHADVATMQARSMALYRKQQDAWKVATVDPNTGAIIGPPGSPSVDTDDDEDDSSTPSGAETQTDIFRAAAAESVLAARTARLTTSH
jgi:hypothetical protein